MTAHPNAQLLRDAYQALEHADLQPMLALLSDDATWTDATLGPHAGIYRKDQVPELFAAMMGVYGFTLRVEIASLIADDDHGIVLTTESGTADGQAVTWTGVHVYSFANGRATSFTNYCSAEYQRFWAGRHTDARS